MKIILDTNILISSFVFDGQIETMLERCLENDNITLLCSQAIWAEITTKFQGGRVLKISQKSKRIYYGRVNTRIFGPSKAGCGILAHREKIRVIT